MCQLHADPLDVCQDLAVVVLSHVYLVQDHVHLVDVDLADLADLAALVVLVLHVVAQPVVHADHLRSPEDLADHVDLVKSANQVHRMKLLNSEHVILALQRLGIHIAHHADLAARRSLATLAVLARLVILAVLHVKLQSIIRIVVIEFRTTASTFPTTTLVSFYVCCLYCLFYLNIVYNLTFLFCS